MEYLGHDLYSLYANVNLIIMLLIVVVHMLCALAVSKDLGNFSKRNITPQLMPGFSWIIAVLITGIWGLFIYWVMHHSSLSRK